MSGIVGAELPFFAQEAYLPAQEYINADDAAIAFSLYLMDKNRWMLIEIRSRAIFSWTNRLGRFSSYFKILL